MRVFYGDYSGYALRVSGYARPDPPFSLLHHWFNVIAPQIWLDTGLEYTGLFARSNGRFDLKKLQLKDTLISRYGGFPDEPERVRKMVDTVGLVAFFANLPAVKPVRSCGATVRSGSFIQGLVSGLPFRQFHLYPLHGWRSLGR